MDKLPFLEIAKSGYRLVYYNWQSMVKLGLIPFAIILAVAVINALVAGAMVSGGSAGAAGMAAGLSLLALLLNLLSVASIVPFLVAWHRFTFEVAENRAPQVSLAVTKTEFVYFGYMIVFGVVMAIVYALLMVILGPIVGLLSLLGLLYLVMRFAFVFPEIALGRKTDPTQSWRQTAKDHLELWLLALMVIVPMFVIGLVLSTIAFGLAGIPVLGVIISIVLHILSVAIYIAFLAAFTSALTLAYKRVVG